MHVFEAPSTKGHELHSQSLSEFVFCINELMEKSQRGRGSKGSGGERRAVERSVEIKRGVILYRMSGKTCLIARERDPQ